MNQQKPRASSLKSATMFHPLHFNLFFSEVKQDFFPQDVQFFFHVQEVGCVSPISL